MSHPALLAPLTDRIHTSLPLRLVRFLFARNAGNTKNKTKQKKRDDASGGRVGDDDDNDDDDDDDDDDDEQER